jgi:hypothetical protein
MGEPHSTPVMLESSAGANFVWIVWALSPGDARMGAICSTEAIADKYIHHLSAVPSLTGFMIVKEHVVIDHAFGYHDSLHVRVQRRGKEA